MGSSFYHLAEVDISTQACQGTACFVARQRNPGLWQSAESAQPRVYCLGRCYDAPARALDTTEPTIGIGCDTAVVLRRCAYGGNPELNAYLRDDGYQGLSRAMSMGPEPALREIEISGLRGRGGAGYPTADKWRVVRTQPEGPRVVVVNADEGDSGAYIDRMILERDPHSALEGLAIAAFVVGAEHAYMYVRREYPGALAAVRSAVNEAHDAGVLGDAILGSGPRLTVTIIEGKGSYLCGEETAMLNAIEGRRPMVRARPPHPAQSGLFGVPTVVNNVETLANVPWILRHGGAAYAAMGSGNSRGTKAVSLNSLFAKPGLYEVELGTPLPTIVEDLGGGVKTGLHGVMVGGPLAAVLPPQMLDVPFTFGSLSDVGAGLGHGGVVAFDDTTSVEDLVRHVFRFGAYESCGACTPCRVGAARIEELFSAPLTTSGWEESKSIVRLLAAASLCGHGTGLADFARSVFAHYSGEHSRCRG